MANAPKFTNGKHSAINIKELGTVKVTELSAIDHSAIYKIQHHGVEHDLALFLNPAGGKKLFIFFSGAANRKAFTLPVFHRWSWHDQFPGHALYISDPTLKRSSTLPLGWYIGDQSSDLNSAMCDIFRAVARNVGIDHSNIVFYGSSGGGFASLRALSEIPSAKAIVINPQTRLSSFNGNSLKDYLGEFFSGVSVDEFSARFPERNEVRFHVDRIEDSRIVYAQCLDDQHHMSLHLPELFTNDSGSIRPRSLRNCSLVFFNDPRGHAHGEPNELVPILLSKADGEGSDTLYSGISS
ncbi:hypothetical protein [Szabonella alba]|uniref:Uncharacterized protein n=1 Tax=Szabonella alba TaxID=2804194 RepID=A0A8K0VDZ1_9RHOB|nr:hypothetical protein [Szabonella alba]MBL4919356.1 hypothetical protein [Szabonella alba]